MRRIPSITFAVVLGAALFIPSPAHTAYCPGPNMTNAASDMLERVSKSIVRINVGFDRRRATGFGTGTLVTSSGLVTTNEHVIRKQNPHQRNRHTTVTLPGYRSGIAAEVVYANEAADFAILQLQDLERHPKLVLDPVPLGDSDALRPGDIVFAAGYPHGRPHLSVTHGTISSKVYKMDGADFRVVEIDNLIRKGNSGGALVTCEGALVGIPTVVLGGVQVGAAPLMRFAIPINDVKSSLDHTIELGGATVEPADWGVTVGDLIDAMRNQFNIPKDIEGVVVSHISQDGAAHGRLQPFDVVVSVNDHPVQDSESFRRITEYASSPMTVTVYRRGTLHTVTLELP